MVVKGIRVTGSTNNALLSSFWLLDDRTNGTRCLIAEEKSEFAAGVVASSPELSEVSYKEAPVGVHACPKVKGGQHLNANILTQEILEDAVANLGEYP